MLNSMEVIYGADSEPEEPPESQQGGGDVALLQECIWSLAADENMMWRKERFSHLTLGFVRVLFCLLCVKRQDRVLSLGFSEVNKHCQWPEHRRSD